MTYTSEDYADALDRIGRTSDGRLLRHMLIIEVQSTISDTAPDGALRAHEARRNFATKLLRQLDPKPDTNGRTESDASLADPGRTALTGASARTGPRRRVPDTVD